MFVIGINKGNVPAYKVIPKSVMERNDHRAAMRDGGADQDLERMSKSTLSSLSAIKSINLRPSAN